MIPDNLKSSFIEELSPDFSILLFVRSTDADIGGNAVVIAPYVAITPAHVVYNNKFESFSRVRSSEDMEQYCPNESLNLLMYSAEYKNHYLLNVDRVVIVNGSDLALLYLNDLADTIPNDAWNAIALNLTPPDIDNHVFTIGSQFQEGSYAIEGGVININPSRIASFGTVRQFILNHPQSGPGFYATLTTFNTLSGSPVYNKDKELIGLISRGHGDENDPMTFVSVLYPLFASKFKHNNEVDRYLYDLARNEHINCKSLDRLEISGDAVQMVLPRSLQE